MRQILFPRHFLRRWSIGLVVFAMLAPAWGRLVAAPPGDESKTRPNIVFFLTDDQRFDVMGCAGHPVVKTPTMDRLARQGVYFRNAFVTTSICAASRASILTGLYERTHKFTFGTPPIRAADVAISYPALLRRAGYRTGFVGKFGVAIEGRPGEVMFDYFVPLRRSPYIKRLPDGTRRHVTEIAGDKAIEFLRACRKDQPFCLSISFNAPHAEDGDKKNHYPWPKAVDHLYRTGKMPQPRLADPKIFASQPKFLQNSMNRHRFFWRWDTPEKYDKNIRAYFRMISGVDRVMGRVLAELEKLGFADNTIVIFCSDNGYYLANRGFAGKWSHYEDSLRIPMIVYDPRLPPSKRGRRDEHMVLNIDVPPTILDYAGVPIPKRYQGRSLRPLIEGRPVADWRTDFFCEHLMRHRDIPKWEGVRGQRWVYARYFEQKPVFEFLHDLKTDPDQLKNFATDPRYKDVLEKMRKRCDELRDRYGGPYSPERFPGKKRPAGKRKKTALDRHAPSAELGRRHAAAMTSPRRLGVRFDGRFGILQALSGF